MRKFFSLDIITKSYPRAALIGNPSDGYFGKTIAFLFCNFQVTVTLKESSQIEIMQGPLDHPTFKNLEALTSHIDQYGYYGGIRLIKAALKKFSQYCREQNTSLDNKNFSIQYTSTIPNRLGLAGSSAIITAVMKALMQFYHINIPNPILANWILSVETDELEIGAGLQDRVAQVYEKPVYMNFEKALMVKQGYGEYITMRKDQFPPFYIAYRTSSSEGSEILHNNLRERYKNEEKQVLNAVKEWSSLTEEVRKRLESGEQDIGDLLNQNFNLRRSICAISAANLEMIETARSVGASAKFTGSGGAIIGTYNKEEVFEQLCEAMNRKGIQVIKPQIIG